MGGNGLDASIWAPRPGEHRGPRPGDWDCGSCNASNFAWRKECFRCTPSKGNILVNKHFPPADHLPASGLPQWENVGSQNGLNQANGNSAPMQSMANFTLGEGKPQSMHYANNRTPRTASGNQPRQVQNTDSLLADRLDPQKYGLATSRWAPRNYRPENGQSEDPQIWTRTVQVAKTQPQTSNPTSPIPNLPDLGLPYEVQHFILAMIQRILEEGSYDFACRWIPQKLVEYGWSCAELVELSTWRKMLPELLPPNAIIPIPGISLEKGLANAVRIRNSAVHRHLCDNVEIKRMASQAQNLMAMFSDVTRENKLHHLQIELGDWDVLSRADPQAARNKLQTALQEITERPMNDMDWSPNSVTLEEIGYEQVFEPAPQIVEVVPEEHHFGFGDEMELD